jgi:hypothetical protein
MLHFVRRRIDQYLVDAFSAEELFEIHFSGFWLPEQK